LVSVTRAENTASSDRRLGRERTTPRVDTEIAVATTRSNSGASFRSEK